MFPIYAIDAKTAAEIAKEIPRVKRERKECVLAVYEVSFLEFFIIEMINNKDPYLNDNYLDVSDEEISRRRVALPESRNAQNFEGKAYRDNVFRDKTADMYDDDCVLQKYFGPIKNGDYYIYPTNANKVDLLNEYIDVNCAKLGIKQKNITILSAYYQLYGENNRLGISFDGWRLFFKRGERDVSVPLKTEQVDKILKSQLKFKYAVENKDSKTQILQEIENMDYVSSGRQTEKFLARMKKTNEMKKQQMGE